MLPLGDVLEGLINPSQKKIAFVSNFKEDVLLLSKVVILRMTYKYIVQVVQYFAISLF